MSLLQPPYQRRELYITTLFFKSQHLFSNFLNFFISLISSKFLATKRLDKMPGSWCFNLKPGIGHYLKGKGTLIKNVMKNCALPLSFTLNQSIYPVFYPVHIKTFESWGTHFFVIPSHDQFFQPIQTYIVQRQKP